MRLAGWDLSVQGKVAPKTTLLLYLFLVEVPPDQEHTVILSARGMPQPCSPAALTRAHRRVAASASAHGPMDGGAADRGWRGVAHRVGTAGLAAETQYFIELKGVASGAGAIKATGAALASGRFTLTIPAPGAAQGG